MAFLLAVSTLGILGLLIAVGLGFASKKFAVAIDPRIEQIAALLPGANCGACGYAGCADYAKAIVEKGVECNCCAQCPVATQLLLGQIVGRSVEVREPQMAVIHCGSTYNETRMKFVYFGFKDCRAMLQATAGAGFMACEYGCVGLSTCAKNCPFDAIDVLGNGAVVVNPKKCTGCGNCVRVCPRNVISLIPRKADIAVLCANPQKGKNVKLVCDVGCISCNRCIKKCENNSMTMQNNVPVVDYDMEAENKEVAEVCPTYVIIDFRTYDPIKWVTTRREMIEESARKKKEKAEAVKMQAGAAKDADSASPADADE